VGKNVENSPGNSYACADARLLSQEEPTIARNLFVLNAERAFWTQRQISPCGSNEQRLSKLSTIPIKGV
jgi:cytidine deaminase